MQPQRASLHKHVILAVPIDIDVVGDKSTTFQRLKSLSDGTFSIYNGL